MAAAASSFSPALSSPPSISKTLKPNPKPFSLGFTTSISKGLKALRATTPGFVGVSALGAKMVSVPAIKPLTSLDFETKVFKKEKVNLAGHDEVFDFCLARFLFVSREVVMESMRNVNSTHLFYVPFLFPNDSMSSFHDELRESSVLVSLMVFGDHPTKC